MPSWRQISDDAETVNDTKMPGALYILPYNNFFRCELPSK